MAIPLTNYTMRVATDVRFMEANQNGWNLIFDVTNVGTTPVRGYVVRFSFIY